MGVGGESATTSRWLNFEALRITLYYTLTDNSGGTTTKISGGT